MAKSYPKAQNPLILRYHRLIEAFSKSDDERDFYLDRVEGAIVFINLDKNEEEILAAEQELKNHPDRFCPIPKLSFFETKKFMEGFVNEKVYDIDTKEKLLDIIGSKEARENFLEFIYDHLPELDKWQQYYHERSRIRIIEWLRQMGFVFVFEDDLELSKNIVEKLKSHTFDPKVSKDVQAARDALVQKSQTYYSSEALNPRPKRGRPPKQVAKVELEPQLIEDIYTQLPPPLRPFLFVPEYSSNAVTFSAKFATEAQMRASMKGTSRMKVDTKLEVLSQRLESLRHLSGKLKEMQIEETNYDKKIQKAITAGLEGKVSEETKTPRLAKLVEGVLPRKQVKKTAEDKPKVKRVIQIKHQGKKKS